MMMLTDEYRCRILMLPESNQGASRRDIPGELEVSLGLVNFWLQALVEKGLIKANNLRNSTARHAFLYLLTPKGIHKKAKVTVRFLKVKLDEYETLKREVSQLQREAGRLLQQGK